MTDGVVYSDNIAEHQPNTVVKGSSDRLFSRRGELGRVGLAWETLRSRGHVFATSGQSPHYNYGRQTPLATIVAHVAYGAIVGGFVGLAG